MEVTLDISEEILELLRKEANRCGKTMSALVESALVMTLPQGKANLAERAPTEPPRNSLLPLPTWKAEFLVDVSNKEELYRALDDDADSHVRRLRGD